MKVSYIVFLAFITSQSIAMYNLNQIIRSAQSVMDSSEKIIGARLVNRSSLAAVVTDKNVYYLALSTSKLPKLSYILEETKKNQVIKIGNNIAHVMSKQGNYSNTIKLPEDDEITSCAITGDESIIAALGKKYVLIKPIKKNNALIKESLIPYHGFIRFLFFIGHQLYGLSVGDGTYRFPALNDQSLFDYRTHFNICDNQSCKNNLTLKKALQFHQGY